MIIVKIFGGLGNQLFQYAAARALSLRSGTTLKMDIGDSLIRDDHNRIYGLQHFNIKADLASPEEIDHLLGKPWVRKATKYLQNKTGLALHPTWWNQTYMYHQNYDRALMKPVKNDVYLNGYWQDENFFKDYRQVILEELQVRYEPDTVNRQIMQKMASVNAVSLHVRRGDALSHPVSVKIYKLPSEEYYRKAIAHIAAKVKNPHFFVFSDDIPWCRENLSTGFPTEFVDHNGDTKNYEDIRLMSHCRHHITANSTFSWWGAWLNPAEDKVVTSPAEWFQLPKMNRNNIVPANWTRF
jgi:hypothetical protein